MEPYVTAHMHECCAEFKERIENMENFATCCYWFIFDSWKATKTVLTKSKSLVKKISTK